MRRAVGIFFFLGLILLGAMTLWVDKEIRLFGSPGTYYYVVVPDAAGLQEGAQVWLAGINAGRITKVGLLPDGSAVRADFVLHPEFCLRQDSQASLEPTSMLTNSRTLHLTAGRADRLPGGANPAQPTLVKQVKPAVGIQDVVEKADRFLGELKDSGPAIKEAAESIRNISVKIDKGDGTLAKFVNDPKLYEDLKAAVGRLNDGLESFKNIAAKAEKGEGSLGKLLNDETLYNNLRDASKDLGELAKKLNSSEGTLGKLVNDPALYDDVKRAAASLAAVMGKIEKGEGTLGRLVADESLYVEARRLLKEAREAVEDAREQAPITAFSSVIFAAFQ